MPTTIDEVRTEIENIYEIRKGFVTMKKQPYEISFMADEDIAMVKTLPGFGDVASPSFVMKVPFYDEFEMELITPGCIVDAAVFLATASTHERDNGY